MEYDLSLKFRNPAFLRKFLLFEDKYLLMSKKVMIVSSFFMAIFLCLNYYPNFNKYSISNMIFFILSLISVSFTILSYIVFYSGIHNLTHKLVILFYFIFFEIFIDRDISFLYGCKLILQRSWSFRIKHPSWSLNFHLFCLCYFLYHSYISAESNNARCFSNFL